MSQTREPATVLEDHPIRHEWYLKGDFVKEKGARGRILLVQREEKCYHCPTERITVIDCKTWTVAVKPRYVYVRGVVILRIEKPVFLKREFLRTTDLTEVIKSVLQRH